MKMRILWFNLATDADNPTQGFTTTWIRAMAKRADFIHVITMRAGRIEVPENVRVYSVGKEEGYSEPRRAIEFYRHLIHVLRNNRIDVCFSHMIPIFTVLAAPVLRLKRIPIVTWYAHRQVTTTLKLAHYLSDRIITSVETAYRYKHDKLVVVGQGIDTDLFSPDGTASVNPPLLLSVGRLSPIKDLLTFVRAVHLLRQWGYDLQAALIGDAPERDHLYTEQIKSEVERLGLNGVVQLAGAVTQEQIVNWCRRCLAHVNLSPTGALDKAALEAIACGKLSLAANEGFRETMGKQATSLLFRHGDAEDLTRKIGALLELSAAEREGIGLYLREQVIQMHNLERLTDKLVALFQEVMRDRR